MSIILFFRSLFFYIGYITTLIPFTCFCLITGFFFPLRIRFKYFLFWNTFSLWWLKICCNINVDVKGLENIPPDPFILLSNHQSPWETIFLYQKFKPINAILKKELFRLPFFGWALAMLKPIAIDRSKIQQARKMLLQQGKTTLEAGTSIMVFPEGTRLNPGQEKSFSSGGATLAVETKTLIIPLAHNAGVHWPARKFLKYPGTIQVVIGKAIETEGRSPRELTAEVKDWIKQAI